MQLHMLNIHTHEKNISGGARQAILAIPGQRCFKLISSHQQGIRNSLSSTAPVYIRKAHQNTSSSAVSELMRFIHHIITYVVPATPRAINWARALTCTCMYVPDQFAYCMVTFHWNGCIIAANGDTYVPPLLWWWGFILEGCWEDGGQGEGGGEGGLPPFTKTGSWKSYAATCTLHVRI